jgi:hypothetical protein
VTIAFGSGATSATYQGGNNTGVGGVSITLTGTSAAGNLLLIPVGLKPETLTDPVVTDNLGTVWTKIMTATGGTGSFGADTGPTKIAWYYRVAVGGETSVTVTTSNATGQVFGGAISRFTKDAAKDWDVSVFTNGADTTNGTAYSATGGSLELAVGDWLFACAIMCGDIGGGGVTDTLTASGVTFANLTARIGNTTNLGNDLGIRGATANVTAGATAAPTYGFTASGNISGVCGFLRLREVQVAPVRSIVVPTTGPPLQEQQSPFITVAKTFTEQLVAAPVMPARSTVVLTGELPPQRRPLATVARVFSAAATPQSSTVVTVQWLQQQPPFVFKAAQPIEPLVVDPVVPLRATVVTASGPIMAPFIGQIGYSPDSGIQADQGLPPVRPTVVDAGLLPIAKSFVHVGRVPTTLAVSPSVSVRPTVVRAQEPPPPVWQVVTWPVVTQGLPIRPTFVDAGPLPIAKSFVYVGKVPTAFVAPPATPMRSTVVAAQPFPQPTQQPQVRRVPPEAATPIRSVVVGAQPAPPQQGQARSTHGFAEAPAPNEVPVPIRPIIVRAQPLPPEYGLANISSGFAEALTPAVSTKPIVIGAQPYPPKVQAPLVAWTPFSEKVVTKPLIVRQQPIPPQAPFIFTPRGGRWGDPVPRIIHPHVNVDMSLPFRPVGWSRVAHGFAEALPQTFEGTITGGIKAGAVTGGIRGTGAGLMGNVQSNGYVTGGTR